MKEAFEILSRLIYSGELPYEAKLEMMKHSEYRNIDYIPNSIAGVVQSSFMGTLNNTARLWANCLTSASPTACKSPLKRISSSCKNMASRNECIFRLRTNISTSLGYRLSSAPFRSHSSRPLTSYSPPSQTSPLPTSTRALCSTGCCRLLATGKSSCSPSRNERSPSA